MMSQARYMRAALLVREHYPEVACIQEAMARRYHVALTLLISPARPQHVAFVRQLAFYATRELTHLSYPEIGDCYGRDHSTVIHGYRVIEARIAHDDAFARSVAELREDLVLELGAWAAGL